MFDYTSRSMGGKTGDRSRLNGSALIRSQRLPVRPGSAFNAGCGDIGQEVRKVLALRKYPIAACHERFR